MKNLIVKGRLIIVLPAVVLMLGSVLTALYGTWLFILLLYRGITEELFLKPKTVVTEFFTIMDIYLLVIIQYLFTVGLWQLFIGELPVPASIGIDSIDQLKAKLASVIILFLSVFFSQQAIQVTEPIAVLYMGMGIAPIIAVLVLYYKVKTQH